jgi:hypothetical protein
MHQDTETEVQDLVYDIKTTILEYLDNIVDEDLLKQKLQPYTASATAIVIVGDRSSIEIRSGSSSRRASQRHASIPHPEVAWR